MSFRTGRMKQALRIRPVNSLKHVVDTSGVVSAGVPSTTDLINTVDAPVQSISNNCHVGSYVRAIFISVQILGQNPYGGVARAYFTIAKNPNSDIALPPPDQVGINDARRYVIHQEMVMITRVGTAGAGGGDLGIPRTFFKGVVLIPNKYQRNGLGDKLQFTIQNATGEATGSSDWCLQCIYKEFY